MFSLTNQYNVSFRMKLVNSSRAIGIGTGPSFGGCVKDAEGDKLIKWANFIMFHEGAANTYRGMVCNPFEDQSAYQLDKSSFEGAKLPEGFKLDSTTLAGLAFFAVAEIEVYSL